jgi:solute carrier family 12 sodium/potassium/chloride transporter 2
MKSSDLIGKNYTNEQQEQVRFDLPLWTDCSEKASLKRDWFKDHVFNVSAPDFSPVYKNYTGIYDNWNSEHKTKGKCTYGSGQNQMTMTYISFTGWLRYCGGFSASLSSAIASMVGAPRILQAVGKDAIYPGVAFFEKGYTANNDPWRGYILCFLGGMICVVIASLNTIGILASNFFLAAYGLMNLSCFHSSYTKSPGWRPSFKYYNQWVSLFSAIVCFVLMFIMNWIYALVTIGIQAVLATYVYFTNPEANWGSAAQAQTIISALNATQTLTDTPDHIKTYRPKLLVLSGNPAHRPSLIDFANIITKKISILITGHVITEQGPVNLTNLKEGMQRWLKDHSIKGYYACTQTPDFSGGAKACMTLAGLGKLSPNMVLIGFKNNWKEDLVGIHQYMDIMYSVFDLRLSFAILRCKEGLDFSSQIASEQQIIREVPVEKGDSDDEDQKTDSLAAPVQDKKTRKISTAVYRGTDGNRLDNNVIASIQQFQQKERTGFIDVWWLYDDGGLTLLIPHIFKTRKQFKNCKLRVFTLANHNDQLDMETRNMASMLSRFRIEYADVTAVPGVTQKADPTTKVGELSGL